MKKKYFLLLTPLLFVLFFLVFKKEKDHVSFQEFKKSDGPIVSSETAQVEVSRKEVVTRRPAQAARRELPQEMQDYFTLRSTKPKAELPTPRQENISGEYSQKGYQFLKKTKAYKLSKEIIERFPNGHQHLGFWIAEHDGEASTEALDVVYHDKRKSYAVLTGALKIMYKDPREADYFRSETEGQEHQSFPHISSVLYKYQDKAFLFKAQKLCLENPSLEICEIEMLEHDRGSR